MSFEKFDNTYEIAGEIRMETPLRIGKPITSYSISSASVLLQYDAARGEYVPFIPGSSLKGVLRSSCERILKTFGMDDGKIREVFGAQKGGAKIRVRDCWISKENIFGLYIEERPHYADRYNPRGNKYVLSRRGFRTEEDIPPFVFDLHIELENVREEEVALVLIGLEEFNYKRAHIGGGVSRGLGFASVAIKGITKKVVEDFSVKKEKKEIKTNDLPLTPVQSFEGGYDFSCYWKANDNSLNGCVVCEMEAGCVSDFKMKVVEEETVKVNGKPIIPGSVIKGFLRKYPDFLNNWNIGKIDDIFGSTRGEGKRARVLVSDAFPVKDLTGYNRIPKGTKLKCWMVFDNMRKRDIKEIVNLLRRENTISGNTSAKGGYNRVKFSVRKAWKFKIDDFGFDVTEKLG